MLLLHSTMDHRVTDPSDWKQTKAPFLSALEESLRCHICKEYFTAPMITSCCHTFCSLCIRRQFDLESRCPACRKQIQLSSLRKNAAIEETVELYKQSRGSLLDLVRESTGGGNERNAEVVEDGAIELSVESRKEQDERPAKRLRTRSVQPENTTENATEDSPSEHDYGHCPVCNEYMKIKDIESKHIAGCLARNSKPNSREGAYTGGNSGEFLHMPLPSRTESPQKLPSVAYSLMTERKLREVVRDLGIPSRGDKQILEQRHKEWINMWNANVDSKHQKSKRELLEELSEWEKTVTESTVSTDIKKIDTKQWNNAHSTDFQDLIAAARRSRLNKTEAPDGSD